jgi:hypothetical protein
VRNEIGTVWHYVSKESSRLPQLMVHPSTPVPLTGQRGVLSQYLPNSREPRVGGTMDSGFHWEEDKIRLGRSIPTWALV